MKLYYFKDPLGNFGDDLNPWLWPQVAPNLLDDDGQQLFVGIGTLINHRVPREPIKHVVGSGFGYGSLPQIDDRWVFHAVRGHETARLLGLSADRVITDAAVLLRTIQLPSSAGPDSAFGFMPHCQSSRDYDWGSLATELGFRYIDAAWSVDRVLAEMRRCRTLVCEAMHGAIVADTLRIPWIPVACYEHISSFKWRDWLSTLDLPYAPVKVPSLYDAERTADRMTRLKNGIKRGLSRVGVEPARWTPPPPAKTGAPLRDQALAALTAASRGPSYLSNEAILERHTDRYVERLHALRRQV
jgi:succinoglycan biosynthesis protein ExoV